MLPSRPCLTASWHPTYVKKKITNHLIDVIWEALGGELNVCPRALGKGRERERWQDHRATVNNVTVWIMSSLFAGASTGLMTETCFWLGLTPTYRCVCMTQYTRTPQHTGGKSGRVASGKGTLVCLVKQRGIKGGRRHHTSLIHPYIVSFDLSIFVIQIHPSWSSSVKVRTQTKALFSRIHTQFDLTTVQQLKCLWWCRSAICCKFTTVDQFENKKTAMQTSTPGFI